VIFVSTIVSTKDRFRQNEKGLIFVSTKFNYIYIIEMEFENPCSICSAYVPSIIDVCWDPGQKI